jgi:hypothetical protein
MVIEESDSDAVGVAEPDVAGTAYREALTSVDGFTRGSGGRVKFNKDTKKRRRENAVEDEDVEMAEMEPARTAGKKKSEVKLGHEFKAKVWIELPSFPEKKMIIMVSHSHRRPAGISRRVGLTHSHTFP